MEKTMNMWVQSGTAVSSVVSRQAQNRVQDTKDDFIRLLQQQKESAGQPEGAKDARKTKDAKIAEKPDEKQTEEPVEEPVDETDLDEEFTALTQMELQQSILQRAVVQIAEPVVESETEPTSLVVSDVSVTENVQEAGELPLEASALPEQPKTEAVSAEVKMDAVKAEVKTDSTNEEVPEQVTELPKEEHREASVTDQHSQDTQMTPSGRQDAVQERKDEFQEELTGEDMDQAASVQVTNAPVQAERPQNVPQTGFREGENTVRSTVEELPQELGKAVTSGTLGDGRVLTVELEPASLGKLTIRLEYEAGRTMVSVMASNPKTLELLGEKASEIAAILKEHTGEETVIYTEQPQREPGEEAQERGGHGRQPEERQQRREEEQHQGNSFMQQLRLGLV